MRVVLLRLSALGDIVHAWPLADALATAQPDIHLTWVVEQPLRPLVEHHPAVDATLVVNTKSWRRAPLASLTRSQVAVLKGRFRELAPELCVDAQGVAKSALIARWTGAPRRVGLARPWRRERLAGLAYTETIAGSRSHRHVVATNLELVRAVGHAPPSEVPSPNGKWLLTACSDKSVQESWTRPFVVLLPGAGRRSKILPVATLARVARAFTCAGTEVAVAWGPGERERAVSICSAAGSGVHLAPPTDLQELAWLLGQSAMVVGGDTGPLHLAASFGVPTLGVFITTSWQRNGPRGHRVRVISAVDDTDDRPSGSSHAPRVRSISAQEIVDAGMELLAES